MPHGRAPLLWRRTLHGPVWSPVRQCEYQLLTCHETLTQDVAQVFSQLTGLGQTEGMTHLWQSPFTMKQALLSAIRREAEHGRAGGKEEIIAKMMPCWIRS